MRYLAGALLCAVLAQEARPCSLPVLIMRDDPRVKAKAYAGETVTVFAMNVRENNTRGEYIAYLKELHAGAYIVVDNCGEKRCVDIYADRNADGKLEDQYHISFSPGFFGKVKAWWDTRFIQGRVKDAMVNGDAAKALFSLENDLKEYRTKNPVPLQQDYERHLADLRRELCSSRIAVVSSENSGISDK